jgi:hypothetical protein
MLRDLLRKLRGALGLGLASGIVWGAIFAMIAAIAGIIDPTAIDPGEDPLRIAAIGAFYGLVSGAIFGAILSLAERGKRIEELSIGRASLWGIVATAVYPLVTVVNDDMVFLLCPLGAALAAGSVAIAKRAALKAARETPTLPSQCVTALVDLRHFTSRPVAGPKSILTENHDGLDQ